jgi:hypothetical protein
LKKICWFYLIDTNRDNQSQVRDSSEQIAFEKEKLQLFPVPRLPKHFHADGKDDVSCFNALNGEKLL